MVCAPSIHKNPEFLQLESLWIIIFSMSGDMIIAIGILILLQAYYNENFSKCKGTQGNAMPCMPMALITRIYNQITLQLNPLKIWQSSNIWNSNEISKSHSWGLKVDYIRGMPATTQLGIFCVTTCYPKRYKLKYSNLWLCSLFHMGAKLGSLNIKLGTEWRCLRIWCYGEHVELNDRNQQESEKAEWSFMICTSFQLLFRLQLKEGGLDGASGIHDKYIQRFGGKT